MLIRYCTYIIFRRYEIELHRFILQLKVQPLTGNLLAKKKEQMELARQIVQNLKELDDAKREYEKEMQQQEEDRRETIAKRPKAKGLAKHD